MSPVRNYVAANMFSPYSITHPRWAQVHYHSSQEELHSPPVPLPIHSGQPLRPTHHQCSETYLLNLLQEISDTCQNLKKSKVKSQVWCWKTKQEGFHCKLITVEFWNQLDIAALNQNLSISIICIIFHLSLIYFMVFFSNIVPKLDFKNLKILLRSILT